MSYAYVTSSDGTRIAYSTVGSGPAAIVVPGALTCAAELDPFASALAAHGATVHTIERRGRGESGDGHEYSIERERDDLEALQRETGARFLFGHSFGGLVALETAVRAPAFTKVALYEPGVSIDGSVPTAWVERCRAYLAAGRELDAFAAFAAGINPSTTGRLPRVVLKQILRLALDEDERRHKQALLASAVREHLEAARLDNTSHRYEAIEADVLLMGGAKGPTARTSRTTLSRLAPVLTRSRSMTFAQLDHFGPEKKPDAVAAAVAAFFTNRG